MRRKLSDPGPAGGDDGRFHTDHREMQTSWIDEVEALIGELRNRLDDGGSSASRRGTITADRDRDGFYLSIITAGGP
jgi:hypothetical protein